MSHIPASELSKPIGGRVLLQCGELTFECIIRDVRITFGRPHFLIVPVAGRGRKWVDMRTVTPVQPGSIVQEKIDGSNALAVRR